MTWYTSKETYLKWQKKPDYLQKIHEEKAAETNTFVTWCTLLKYARDPMSAFRSAFRSALLASYARRE